MYAEFENISEFLVKEDNTYFMFRDFQSRNIIVNENSLCFIDYQGGMRGALAVRCSQFALAGKS